MEELEGFMEMEERRLNQLKDLKAREKEVDRAINKLKRILKKSLDWNTILLI